MMNHSTTLMTRKLIFLLTPILALSLAACSGEKGTIKIGYIGPLTGEAASYGIDTLNGAKLAAKEINAAGGINGQMIEIIAEDGRCTGADAASAAQKLINIDGVVAIIGGQCSGETLAAAPVAEGAEIVMMSPVSSSPDVTRAGDFVFRDYPSDALKTKAMAEYFAEQGFTKVATIGENTDFCVAFRDALKENLGEDALVFDEIVEPGTKDFRSLVTRLKDIEFDVFFPNGQSAASIAAMMQQLREQGLEQLAVSHDVAQDTSLLEIAPEASDGMLAIGVPEMSADNSFSVTFAEKYGAPQASPAFVAHAYDGMRVLAQAIGEAGTEGPAIRDYLYSLAGFDGIVGTFSFDENGDVEGIPYVLYEVQEGKWVGVSDITVN